MNKQQYADYQKTVASFLQHNNVKPGCHGPKKLIGYRGSVIETEPYFSWRSCKCCGSRLGGNREDYQFTTNDGQVFDAAICTDCVYYLTYDCLDDLTMMEVEAS